MNTTGYGVMAEVGRVSRLLKHSSTYSWSGKARGKGREACRPDKVCGAVLYAATLDLDQTSWDEKDK